MDRMDRGALTLGTGRLGGPNGMAQKSSQSLRAQAGTQAECWTKSPTKVGVHGWRRAPEEIVGASLPGVQPLAGLELRLGKPLGKTRRCGAAGSGLPVGMALWRNGVGVQMIVLLHQPAGLLPKGRSCWALSSIGKLRRSIQRLSSATWRIPRKSRTMSVVRDPALCVLQLQQDSSLIRKGGSRRRRPPPVGPAWREAGGPALMRALDESGRARPSALRARRWTRQLP